MDSTNYTIDNRKHKHLDYSEHHTIQLRLKDGHSAYRIAKELNRLINTVLNEIRIGIVGQMVGSKHVNLYFADAGQANYEKNRKSSSRSFNILKCHAFLIYVNDKIKNDNWSLDGCVGRAKLDSLFTADEMVCTKTLYNYVSLGMMPTKAIDLPLILKRKNQVTRVRKHKKHLGQIIEERLSHIENREEFGHWEIDTVIGMKTKCERVIMSLVERQTRQAFFVRIPSKSACAITSALTQMSKQYGSKFHQVFNTITSDSGLELADFSAFGKSKDTGIYFAHPYALHERGANERHGIFRRFLQRVLLSINILMLPFRTLRTG